MTQSIGIGINTEQHFKDHALVLFLGDSPSHAVCARFYDTSELSQRSLSMTA
jgi:hypothetical protein